MIKGIIVLIIIGAVLYAFFGIWGIIVPVVAVVGLIVLIIKSADENGGKEIMEQKGLPVQAFNEKGFEGLTFCCDNVFPLSVRKIIENKVELNGGTITYSITKKSAPDILVTPDISFPSARCNKARDIGIKIIDVNEFYAMAGIENLELSKTETVFEHKISVNTIPIKIEYADSYGERTERNVDIYAVMASSSELYIRGFCHLRNEERTFRVDRVVSASANGELVDFQAFVDNLIKDSPELKQVVIRWKSAKGIGPLKGINFCITGTLCSMKRRQAQERIEELGGCMHGGILPDTHYLVAEDPNPYSSKLSDAKAQETKIIDEVKFLEYLAEPQKAQDEKPSLKNRDRFAVSVNFEVKEAKENSQKKSGRKLIDSDYYDYKLDVGNITVTIEYLPSNEEPFMRTVDIQAILSCYSNLYFGGFCHLRNDETVFSIESVGAAFIGGKPICFREFIKDLIKDDAFLSKAFGERYGGLHGINICVTGISPKKRTEIRNKIKELSGRLHYGVGFDTHFLVRGTALRSTDKLQLATAKYTGYHRGAIIRVF